MRTIIYVSLSLTLLLGCGPGPSSAGDSSSDTPVVRSNPNEPVMDAGKIAYDKGDYATAFAEWSSLANQGDARAINRLGTLYAKGHGVVEDQTKAFELYERAANSGDPVAQSNLGARYFNGHDQETNLEKAEFWMKKSTEQDYAPAQSFLALMYSNGELDPDYAEAERLARKAAAHGDALGQYVLGQLYGNGHGVEQNDAESLRWHRLAADQGDADSQALVGGMLSLAALKAGGDLDGLYEAKRYLDLAIEQGNSFASASLEIVEESIATVEDALYLDLEELGDVVDTYKKNQARFKRDYVGKVFKAQMPLNGISENVFMEGHWTIALGDGLFGTKDVKCKTSNPADVNIIADWNKGDTISVTGLVADVMMGDVELSDCNLALDTSG